MAKRGSSGLSLVVGVDKPVGMSSHDVVNRVRRVFGERRVGHTGTLDPLASGALAVCVGPATRLDQYLVGHDKTYVVTIEFGSSTTTDDAAGDVVQTAPIPDRAYDPDFAARYLEGIVGVHSQMPPAYSAIKVNGQRAYAAARSGSSVELKPRSIEVYEARLLGVDPGCVDTPLSWDVEVSVSKGTYVRSIARDIGLDLGTFAHVKELRRIRSGSLSVEECSSLDGLEEAGESALVDPVPLLGFRVAFVDERLAGDVACGRPLRPDGLELFECVASTDPAIGSCSCTGGLAQSDRQLMGGEPVSVVNGNRLLAVYRHDADSALLKPDCVFSTGVVRRARIAD